MSHSGHLQSRQQIAVIGGGIIGLSLAWRLAQSNWAVTVFEQGSLGAEASWAGAGMLSLGGEIERPSALAKLALQSRRLYSGFIRELQEASGVPIDYQECGALDVAYSSEELEALEARALRQVALEILSKPLAPAQISAFWPRVRTQGLAGGRFYPEDAIVNSRDVTAALAAACRKLSAELIERCRVPRGEVSESRISLETHSGKRHFDAAVIAAGAWSAEIEMEGVLPLPAVEPVKGHLLGYQQPAGTCNTIVRHEHTYLLQRANGLLIAGTSVERVGFDREISSEIANAIAARAGFVLPHLLETSPSEVWVGFRPGSSQLQTGAWHSPRLYLAYGHFRNGILLAPVTAQTLAAEINANLQTRWSASSGRPG